MEDCVVASVLLVHTANGAAEGNWAMALGANSIVDVTVAMRVQIDFGSCIGAFKQVCDSHLSG